MKYTQEEQIRICQTVETREIDVKRTVLDYCLDLRGQEYCDCLDREQRRRIEAHNVHEEILGRWGDGIKEVVRVRFGTGEYDCKIKDLYDPNDRNRVVGIRINFKSEMRYQLGICFAVTRTVVAGKEEKEIDEIYAQEPELKESLSVRFNSEENVVELNVVKTAQGVLAREIRSLAQYGAFELEKKKKGKKSGKEEEKKSNKVRASHGWMKAEQLKHFLKRPDGVHNCVYYLAGEQGEGRPALLYVGKADSLTDRLKLKKRGGKVYIQHPIDSKDYDFTHFRFDEFDKAITPAELVRAEEALIGGLRLCAAERFPNGFEMTNLKFCKAYNALLSNDPPFYNFESDLQRDKTGEKNK